MCRFIVYVFVNFQLDPDGIEEGSLLDSKLGFYHCTQWHMVGQ